MSDADADAQGNRGVVDMSKGGPPSDWRLLGQVQAYPGYVYGCRYPALVLSFDGQPLPRADRDRLWDGFLESCPAMAHPDPADQEVLDWRQSVQWLLSAWQALQVELGLPVFETGRILAMTKTQARCVVPSLEGSQRALASVIQRSLALLAQPTEATTEKTHLQQVIKVLSRFSAKGSNVPRFVKAAFELGLPLQGLPGGAYQYGVAKCARWMDSSFTDVTPTLSTNLARNKVWASALLRQAGLPVPPHQLASDVDRALKVAHRLGYPVVVKPADLDGGVGVAAGLESDDEVRQAFESAKQHSSQILVEKHVEGKDYRITVFNGEVIWAVERVPGGVTGDGQRTVAQLVEQVNADPRRGISKHAPLKQLTLEDEAMHLLSRQGLNDQAVPDVGQFVRLRRAANVASGGTPVAVFDKVHPDNARLAVRAAEALRLDLAGIDLLIPDVATSWRETKAAICEVNGQPNLGQTTAAHLYAPILQQLVPGSGRVATVLIVGAAEPAYWLDAVSNGLVAQGLRVGVVGPHGVTVGGELLSAGDVSTYAGGRMLALNRDVGAMVMAINDDGCLRTGLPVDRYDALILAGANLRSNRPVQGQDRQRWVAELLASLLPACDGVVVTYREGGMNADGLADRTTARWHSVGGAVNEAVNESMQLAMKCVAERESAFEQGGT